MDNILDNFLSSDTLNNITMDTGRFGSALTSSKIFDDIGNNFTKPKTNDWEWIKITILTLVGFCIYNLVVANLINTDNIKNKNVKLAINDSLKFGTMLISVRLLLGESLADIEWIKESLCVLIGLMAYDFGTIQLINTNKLMEDNIISKQSKLAIDDTIKFSTMFFVSTWLSSKNFNKHWLFETTGFIVGIVAYDYLLSEYL